MQFLFGTACHLTINTGWANIFQVPRKGLGATVLKHIKEDSHFAQIQAAKAEQLNDDAGYVLVPAKWKYRFGSSIH